MDDEELLLGAAGAGALWYLSRQTEEGSILDNILPGISDWLSGLINWGIDTITPDPLTGTVAGFTLADWSSAIARGMIPLTSEQLTERWISAAQQANVADAISILFSGQTVDIEVVLAAMQGTQAPAETWEEILARIWIPSEQFAQEYGGYPYYLPAGVPISYLYSGTQAANVLLMEALSGAWAYQSQPWIIQHISDVRGF